MHICKNTCSYTTCTHFVSIDMHLTHTHTHTLSKTIRTYVRILCIRSRVIYTYVPCMYAYMYVYIDNFLCIPIRIHIYTCVYCKLIDTRVMIGGCQGIGCIHQSWSTFGIWYVCGISYLCYFYGALIYDWYHGSWNCHLQRDSTSTFGNSHDKSIRTKR